MLLNAVTESNSREVIAQVPSGAVDGGRLPYYSVILVFHHFSNNLVTFQWIFEVLFGCFNHALHQLQITGFYIVFFHLYVGGG